MRDIESEGRAVELRVLGPIEISMNGEQFPLGKRQHRLILGILAIEANRTVPADRLIDLLWGEHPPKRARAVLHSRISELRGALHTVVLPVQGGTLVTDGGGYALRIAPERVDVHRYRRLVAEARRADSDEELRHTLRAALGLWRGPALGGWLPGQSHDALCRGLESSRLTAAEDLFEAELRLGNHRSIVDELVELSAEHPARDRLTAVLLIALHRSGRTAEAVEAYHRCRQWLRNELGVDPGRPVQELHIAILRDDPNLVAGTTGPVTGATGADPAGPVPRQLPPAVRHFAGRLAELEALTRLVDPPTGADGTVVISSIDGTPGIGKTALAVSWAHTMAHRFVDGQLYVNLRGFDPTGSPMTPAEAVRGFLDTFQVLPQRIPASLDAQVGLYRSLLAGKRVLVVLDNARDAEQVRPLLPGSPGCLVLVTSRNQLSSLVTVEGAHPLKLDLLTPDDARLLLARRLGTHRIAAEPDAVEEIIIRCARLPLGLAIVAARAAANPDFALAALAEELGEARSRLDTLTAGDPASDVRAVFSWSLRALRAAPARLFRLLGLHPGPDISAPAAASLAGLPTAQVRPLLADLAGANLIVEHDPGRFTVHDLLRAYAAELAHADEPGAERAAATHRMLDHYLHTAHAGTRLLNPHLRQINMAPTRPGVTPEQPADHQRAMAWFAAEHPVLLATIEQAAATGWDTHTWQLAMVLAIFLERQGHWHHQTSTARAALAAARRLADPSAQAHAHFYLARAATRLGRFDDADTHLRHALDMHGRCGDLEGQAITHDALAEVWGRQDRHAKALHHATRALKLSRVTNHPVGQARALNTAGWLHAQLGDYDQALTHCDQALALFQDLDDRPGQAATWDSLGYAHHHLGHQVRAIACYRRALDLYRDIGDRHGEFGTLACLGDTHHSAGDLPAARSVWTQALTILDDLDHPDADRVRASLAAADASVGAV